MGSTTALPGGEKLDGRLQAGDDVGERRIHAGGTSQPYRRACQPDRRRPSAPPPARSGSRIERGRPPRAAPAHRRRRPGPSPPPRRRSRCRSGPTWGCRRPAGAPRSARRRHRFRQVPAPGSAIWTPPVSFWRVRRDLHVLGVYRAVSWHTSRRRDRRTFPCAGPPPGGPANHGGAVGAGASSRRRDRSVARGCTAARPAGSGPTSSVPRRRRQGCPGTSSWCPARSSTACRTGLPAAVCAGGRPDAAEREAAGRTGALARRPAAHHRQARPALGHRTRRLSCPAVTADPCCRPESSSPLSGFPLSVVPSLWPSPAAWQAVIVTPPPNSASVVNRTRSDVGDA